MITAPTSIQVIHNSQGLPAFAVLRWEDYLRLTHPSKNLLSENINLEHAVPSDVVDMVFDKNYSPLKAWRLYLELTQEDMANRLNISQSAYSQYEMSEKLRKTTRQKVAQALGIHSEQLDF